MEKEFNEMDQWQNDKNLIEELNSRSADLKSGKDKGMAWEELKKEIKRNEVTKSQLRRSCILVAHSNAGGLREMLIAGNPEAGCTATLKGNI